MTPPRLAHTSLGYEYARCRAGGDDSTVYVHQLVAILAGADPREVFDPDVDVHHRNSVPWDNRPENVELRGSREHRTGHLQGVEA
jgi:hypothetical protein